MRQWKRNILLTMLMIVLAGVGFACVFQNEIQAVMYYLRYTAEEQSALEAENDSRLEEALTNANLSKEQIEVESAAEEAQVASPTQPNQASASEEKPESKPVQQKDPVKQETPKNNAEQKKEPVKEEQDQKNKEDKNTEQEESNDKEYDAELAAMVGEIYALRTSFVGQLDALLEEAKEEYIALPEEERDKQKMSLVSKYIGIAGGLEKSCDNQMEEILGRIQAHLKETNGDLSLVEEIHQVYKNEKALKKSYYMSMLD